MQDVKDACKTQADAKRSGALRGRAQPGIACETSVFLFSEKPKSDSAKSASQVASKVSAQRVHLALAVETLKVQQWAQRGLVDLLPKTTMCGSPWLNCHQLCSLLPLYHVAWPSPLFFPVFHLARMNLALQAQKADTANSDGLATGECPHAHNWIAILVKTMPPSSTSTANRWLGNCFPPMHRYNAGDHLLAR